MLPQRVNPGTVNLQNSIEWYSEAYWQSLWRRMGVGGRLLCILAAGVLGVAIGFVLLVFVLIFLG